MTELNRQQICATLAVSESTIRRLEQLGLPFTPVGVRSHRYDLAECKKWLLDHYGRPAEVARDIDSRVRLDKAAAEYVEASKKVKLRVMPS